MNYKNIANDYGMDEKDLTDRLTKIQQGYKEKEQEFKNLKDEKDYKELADKIANQAGLLKQTLGNAPSYMRGLLVREFSFSTSDDKIGKIYKTEQIEDALEYMCEQAHNFNPTVQGRATNFHRKWLVSRLTQTFHRLSKQNPTKERLTDFMTDVCVLWGVDPKGLRSVITELRKQGIK